MAARALNDIMSRRSAHRRSETLVPPPLPRPPPVHPLTSLPHPHPPYSQVADMLNPEYYVGEFQRADGTWATAKYADQVGPVRAVAASTPFARPPPCIPQMCIPIACSWRSLQQ